MGVPRSTPQIRLGGAIGSDQGRAPPGDRLHRIDRRRVQLIEQFLVARLPPARIGMDLDEGDVRGVRPFHSRASAR